MSKDNSKATSSLNNIGNGNVSLSPGTEGQYGNQKSEKRRTLSHLADRFRNAGLKGNEALGDIKIENCIGFTQVPLGVAGPLTIVTRHGTETDLYAPLATYEATLIASCSRGCKAFNASGGIRVESIKSGMMRAPVFQFQDTAHAVEFAQAVPSHIQKFAEWVAQTSSHTTLQRFEPSVIGSQVHLLCTFNCGGATGQNMVTKASQYACERLRELLCETFGIQGFFIEGNLSGDKKPSWGNVKHSRGVEVIAWGTLTAKACQTILGLEAERLHVALQTLKEGGIRSGHFGSNVNTANVISAMFISTGQDPASTAEASWTHLTSELDPSTRSLKLSLYLPSLPVGTVGGGMEYSTQKEALRLLRCDGPGDKHRLASFIAAFCLALEASTSAAIANDTFTASHMKFARGGSFSKL